MISKEEKLSREKAVRTAIDSNRLEGMIVDDEALIIFNKWVEGEIQFDDVRRGIDELCGI
ncbi:MULTISPECIES: antitoxin VbhA family protein [Pasteurellaceae]|uniref:Antitoxin VbhA family protein n=2 Tax=Avibacterium TaxID=292486 RepID=A0ABU7QT10_AVIPA|nr:antitoxin VbhA family protein [Avibacterium paragallinarum]